MSFVILEDDRDRAAALVRAARDAGFRGDLLQFARADQCIAWLSRNLATVQVLSLDHDLVDAQPGATDPGDGRQVADWLAQQPVRLPVIVHSSNAERAAGMCCRLAEASFPVYRVVPLADDWIEADWSTAVLECIHG